MSAPTARERETLVALLDLQRQARGPGAALADARRQIALTIESVLKPMGAAGVDVAALLDELDPDEPWCSCPMPTLDADEVPETGGPTVVCGLCCNPVLEELDAFTFTPTPENRGLAPLHSILVGFGRVVAIYATAYEVQGVGVVSFDKAHGRPTMVSPLVVFG